MPVDANDKTHDVYTVISTQTLGIPSQKLSIMTHWHDTLVIAKHRLSQSLSSHVDANNSQQY